MNPQQELIANACMIEVLDEDTNKFTPEQRIELLKLIENFQNINLNQIYAFYKHMKHFEVAFLKYGGNERKIEKRLNQIKQEMINAAIKSTKR